MKNIWQLPVNFQLEKKGSRWFYIVDLYKLNTSSYESVDYDPIILQNDSIHICIIFSSLISQNLIKIVFKHLKNDQLGSLL
jgi:hypothetical protein